MVSFKVGKKYTIYQIKSQSTKHFLFFDLKFINNLWWNNWINWNLKIRKLKSSTNQIQLCAGKTFILCKRIFRQAKITNHFYCLLVWWDTGSMTLCRATFSIMTHSIMDRNTLMLSVYADHLCWPSMLSVYADRLCWVPMLSAYGLYLVFMLSVYAECLCWVSMLSDTYAKFIK